MSADNRWTNRRHRCQLQRPAVWTSFRAAIGDYQYVT